MKLSHVTSALALGTIILALACGGGGGADSTTEVSTTGSIAGKVVDTDSANGGVGGASVQISLAGAAAQTVSTSSAGQFTVANLTPGEYTVSVTPPSGRLLLSTETGTRSAVVVAGKTATTIADFKLARPKGSLSGSVKNGVSGVPSVTLTLSRAGFLSKPITADASGNFTLASIPSGSWILSLNVPGTLQLAAGELGTRSVDIVADQVATVPAFAVETRTQATGRTIDIVGSSFSPQNLTISAGTTVTWINDDAASHTITPQNADQPGVFGRVSFGNSGVVLTHTFSTPGQVYHYRCEIHSDNFTSGMVGTITVQ